MQTNLNLHRDVLQGQVQPRAVSHLDAFQFYRPRCWPPLTVARTQEELQTSTAPSRQQQKTMTTLLLLLLLLRVQAGSR